MRKSGEERGGAGISKGVKGMKRCFLGVFILTVTMAFLFASALRADWTFMVYLDGDNNLESNAIDDFLEMAQFGSTTDLDIIVQFDRIPEYDSSWGDWTTTKRFRVTRNMTPITEDQIEDIGEANMGDPQTLIDFVTWAQQSFPSDKYALILWNHGDGWSREMTRPGKESVCTDSTDSDRLNMKELQNAFSSIGGRLDLIGFDACLMSMIEVAYEIRDYGDVMVGSEEVEPDEGWPYQIILEGLQANPSWSAQSLAVAIVEAYYSQSVEWDVLSAIHLNAVGDLAMAVSDLAQALIDHRAGDYSVVAAAAETVKTRIDETVLYELHGASWPGAHGLAIYFPQKSVDFDIDYNDTVIDFPRDTQWEEFLQEFYSSMGDSWISNQRTITQQFYEDSHIDLYNFCERLQTEPGFYYIESLINNEFGGGGTPRNWKGDDESWIYSLPFPFPFFREEYSSVYVHSNGYLDFAVSESDPTPSMSKLADNLRIAPFWQNLRTNGSEQTGEDIYIAEFDDRVAIRWVAEHYNGEGGWVPVNMETILHRNGRIKFNYGEIGSIEVVPTIGISKGDGTNYCFSSYNDQTNLSLVATDLYTPVSAMLSTVHCGDYDGDGTSDIAVFRDSTGYWTVRGITRASFGTSPDTPVSGDYDGDGTAEIGIFRAASGLWAVRGVTRVYFGSSSDIPVPGDYDGDGRCEVGIFRSGSGLWAIRGFTRTYFGTAGDLPQPGDYNGDATSDIGLFRAGTGLWALRGVSRIYFGDRIDIPIPGDFKGDGTWSPAIFRPAVGLWAVRGVTRCYYGRSSDYPVRADYDGDSADDIGIFRYSSGLWAVKGVTRAYYGSSGDIPVTK